MALPEKWYLGPWTVCKEKNLEKRPRLRKGEILCHENGSTLLNCAACNAMQFARVDVIGEPDAPTIRGTVHCGSGHCKKCGVYFSVSGGRTVEAQEPAGRKRPELPAKLVRAGVKFPLRINRG